MGTYRGAVGVPGTHTAIRLVRLSQLTCGIFNNKMRGWEYDCYMNSTVHSRCMGISVYAGARATSGNTVLRPMHAQKKTSFQKYARCAETGHRHTEFSAEIPYPPKCVLYIFMVVDAVKLYEPHSKHCGHWSR